MFNETCSHLCTFQCKLKTIHGGFSFSAFIVCFHFACKKHPSGNIKRLHLGFYTWLKWESCCIDKKKKNALECNKNLTLQIDCAPMEHETETTTEEMKMNGKTDTVLLSKCEYGIERNRLVIP